MFDLIKRLRRTPSEITFHELTDLDSEWGRQALAIYEASFPVDERETLDDLRETVIHRQTNEEVHHFRVMVGADDSVLGITIFTTVHAQYMAFLRFIAVREDMRSQGLGRDLLRDAVRKVRRDGYRRTRWYPYLGIVFEVERPLMAADSEERKLRERRIHWYRRNGGRLFADVDLVTPPNAPGLPPMHYHLMFIRGVPKRIVGDIFQRMMVETVLISGYGEGEDSPYVRRALGQMA